MRIFIDLDNTLICSYPDFHFKRLDSSKVQDELNCFHPNYQTYLRPIARRLIQFCKGKAGEDVYILTAAKRDYALDIIRGYDFGIETSKIFARDDLSCYKPNDFRDGKNILIDDLPDYDNWNKKKVLNIGGGGYIQIKEYNPLEFWGIQEDEEELELETVKERINKIYDNYQEPQV